MHTNKPSFKPSSFQAPQSQFSIQNSDFKTEYRTYENLPIIKSIPIIPPIVQTSSLTAFSQGRQQSIDSFNQGYQNSESPLNNQASNLLLQRQFQQLPQIKEDSYISFQKENELIPSINKKDQINPLYSQQSQPNNFQNHFSQQQQSAQFFLNEKEQIIKSSPHFLLPQQHNRLSSLKSILNKNLAVDQTLKDLSKNCLPASNNLKAFQSEQAQIKDINLKFNVLQKNGFSQIFQIKDEQSILFSSNLLTEQKDLKDTDLSQETMQDIQIYNIIQKIEGDIIERTLIVDQINKKTTFQDTYCLIPSQSQNNQAQSLIQKAGELENLKGDFEKVQTEKESMKQKYEKQIQDIINSYDEMQTELLQRISTFQKENDLLQQQLTEKNNSTKQLQILTDQQRESQGELEKQLKLFIEMNDSFRKQLSFYLSSSNQSQFSLQSTPFIIQNIPNQGATFQQKFYSAPQPPPPLIQLLSHPSITPPSQILNNFQVNEQKFDFEKYTTDEDNQNEKVEEEESSFQKGTCIPEATKTNHIQKFTQQNNEKPHKSDRKNIAKNFINAFRIFINKVEQQDLQDYFRQQNTSNTYSCITKLRKLFNSFLECNNPSMEFVIYLIQHQELSIVFKFFIEQRAEQWIQQSQLHDKQTHFEQLEILKKSFYSSIAFTRVRRSKKKNQKPIQVPEMY